MKPQELAAHFSVAGSGALWVLNINSILQVIVTLGAIVLLGLTIRGRRLDNQLKNMEIKRFQRELDKERVNDQ